MTWLHRAIRPGEGSSPRTSAVRWRRCPIGAAGIRTGPSTSGSRCASRWPGSASVSPWSARLRCTRPGPARRSAVADPALGPYHDRVRSLITLLQGPGHPKLRPEA